MWFDQQIKSDNNVSRDQQNKGYNFFIYNIYRRRDRAHIQIKNVFYEVINRRRQAGNKPGAEDMLHTLMHTTYK